MPFPESHMNTPSSFPSTRRRFLKTGSLAAVAGALAPHIVIAPKVHAQNSETLKVGLIGCGGRGSGAAAQAMKSEQNVVLTAMGDVFEDRLRGSLASLKQENPEKCQVDP